jgi:23S rRNA (uridine2552-2'-O)-methyltransferase
MTQGKKSGGGAGRGVRELAVRVKTARKRKPSSTLWLQRQLNDPYVAAAKREGYRSRAAYKLSEMDDKLHFLKPGKVVIDLGSTPGGWSQVAAKRCHSQEGRGRVIAIDINEMEPIPGVDFQQMDFMEDTAPDAIRAMLGGALADIVLSDMASPATGHRQTDHIRIMALCEAAALFAREVLAEGGWFVAKVLAGGTEHELIHELRRDYRTVRHLKPKASRADSTELYVVASGFRGRGEEGDGSDRAADTLE